ncbi:hypothetical protein [Demequina litorisediminis]|nr:hypothetical protein [Demequina litorisediminis]
MLADAEASVSASLLHAVRSVAAASTPTAAVMEKRMRVPLLKG